MTRTCPYCGRSVPDEEYPGHLERAHEDELEGLDRRLVARRSGSRSRPRKLYVLGGVVLVLFAAAYLAIFALSSATSPETTAVQQPDPDAPTHLHGAIHLEYDGAVVDFDDPMYIERDGCFHFHAYDDAERWHVHCEDVTLEYALGTLGFELSADSLAVDGETFSEDDPGTTVSTTVDGERVDPERYVLEDGDDVRVVVETNDER
ncbi:hypothetical protein [Natronococcus occultus]|uniref:C2H2-type domain-containing protein n=1 Tax=Natronococcus occultus SP4 TaxID=694430 RepID=L0JSZ3_9EURY|nr:hypothetical protein [Natronococcus occultus]AGB36132.1 hypothetical protein Natoc_0257 [Natronococcus occultus SP4]